MPQKNLKKILLKPYLEPITFSIRKGRIMTDLRAYFFFCQKLFFILSTTSFLLFAKRAEALFPHERQSGFYLGPEFYYLQREREGGTHQDGVLYGLRLGYERIKRFHWYAGLDVLYATGKLEGRSASGRKIKSQLTDTLAEGRLGYTFQYKKGTRAFLTPFFGFGYFHELNDFEAPTPLPITFHDNFGYFTWGVLTGMQIASHWNIGINFKMRWMLNGTSDVTDDPDPEVDDVTLLMESQYHYRFEVPIGYQYPQCNCHFELDFIPFYEYRHFGGRENFPFDFIDTRYHLWGARLEAAYRF